MSHLLNVARLTLEIFWIDAQLVALAVREFVTT
jgi:hypothetical protein